VTNWNFWPHSHIRSLVAGDVYDDSGTTKYFVDMGGVLHVTHRDHDGDTRVRTYKLVEVKPSWEEVDDD
jgi:hypothetical protein